MINPGADALGPRPPAAGEGPAPLSPQRADLLEALRRVGSATVSALAEATGLHENTVREHLDGLVEQRLVARRRAPRSGRGRPAWEYVARAAHATPSVRDHAALAGVLAGQIARSSSDPAGDARAAGRRWGEALTAGEAPETSSEAARHRVIDLLDEMGFAPQADPQARTALLRRCPILEAARQYPVVVCGVHAGLVGAALETLGAPEDAGDVALQPFAVPGACVLHLGRAAVTRLEAEGGAGRPQG